MRYAIGCSTYVPDRGRVDGVYVQGRFGFAWICTPDADPNKITESDYVVVFDTLKDVQKCIEKLNKQYRFEFNSRAKRFRIPRDYFRFYPIKVDSTKFPLKLLKRKASGGKDGYSYKEYLFEKK